MSRTQNLTIARGLRRAKKLEGQIAERAKRLAGCSSWQSGRKPAFDFVSVLGEHDERIEELSSLRVAIARANALTTVELDGEQVTLTALIRRMQELKGRAKLMEGLNLQQGVETVDRGYDRSTGTYLQTEVEYKAVWTEPERASNIEAIRDELEQLSELIEEANHRTVLEL